MFAQSLYSGNRQEDYALVLEQARHLWEDELPLISNLSNISALLKSFFDRTNWAGFYVWNEARQELVLGPFQGLVACTRIPLGKGVCGTAVKNRQTQIVPDVSLFPGHIACDSASQSEIVIPVMHKGKILGVIDIDSPEKNRFDEIDSTYLERLGEFLAEKWVNSLVIL